MGIQAIYICNTRHNDESAPTITVDAKSNLDQLNDKVSKYSDQDIIWIIDLHCRFKNKDKMLDMGGIKVYEYLQEKTENLRVIFYSPLSKEFLQKEYSWLNPYIEHCFIELIDSNIQFQESLNNLIRNDVCSLPQFNVRLAADYTKRLTFLQLCFNEDKIDEAQQLIDQCGWSEIQSDFDILKTHEVFSPSFNETLNSIKKRLLGYVK